MKLYKIPFDVKHEEKIFGGYLSLRQVLYLLLTILAGSVFFINIQVVLKLTIFSFFAIVFLSFAFIRIHETRLDKYVVDIVKYMFRKKRYQFLRWKGVNIVW